MAGMWLLNSSKRNSKHFQLEDESRSDAITHEKKSITFLIANCVKGSFHESHSDTIASRSHDISNSFDVALNQ